MNLNEYTPPTTARNYKGEQETIKRPRGFIIAVDARGPLELIRRSKKRFAVVYGLEVTDGLEEHEAARVYGESLMHLCQCEGLLD